MVLIYTHKITSRNKYTFKLFFKEIIGVDFTLTSDLNEFKKFNGAKINYSKHIINDEIFFYSTELLFETGIIVQEPSFLFWNNTKVFYPTLKNSTFPFDPFAAGFFLTSRYEEYLPHIKDEHGRFDPTQSTAYIHGFLDRPVVNEWALEIKKIIELKHGKLKTKERKYNFIPTIDIDNAWAYKHKGFIRVGSGIFADLFNFNFKRFSERVRVLFRRANDPYDTYQYQIDLIEKYNLNCIYFFLLGDYAQYDKNVPYQNNYMQSLIKLMEDYGQVGIHPSYASNSEIRLLKNEIARLSIILHQEIHLSRQHFLKMSLPETYQNLIDADITDDYTMGYAQFPGFRASIATPYFFYDLDLEIETQLKLHSFAIMDGTLKDYLKLNPEDCIKIIEPLINNVKMVKGDFIAVWHNESFAENERWKGWRLVFEDLIKLAATN
jgi:hypothetical protein